LVYEDNDAFSSDYTGQVTTMDWRGYLRLSGQQVLATRFVYGRGVKDPKPFQLGGTSNGFEMAHPAATPVTPTNAVFNRRKYALRGYPTGLPALRGRRMALVEAEWRVPLYRLERGFMSPPVGLHQIYGSVFYNAGEAWRDSLDSDEIRQGAGIEVTTELVFGYGLGFNLRAGYANGFDTNGEDQFYLKLGATF
jgi:outer membrane protein assembly factor BamA